MTNAPTEVGGPAESALHEGSDANSILTPYITTSWDDGHPLDFRVAELLTKYGVRGTFYVPRSAEKETMTASQMRQLSRSFELGAHTLHHIVLTDATDDEAWEEIVGSKVWLEDAIGSPCVLFCPPKGRYARRDLGMIRKAGYEGLRTVELCSLNFPRLRAGLFIIPTTVQAYPHGYTAYARNAIKRAAISNLWRFIMSGRSTDWSGVARSFLHHAGEDRGVFHLWGHSWELEEAGQWDRLDEVLRLMGDFAENSVTNSQLYHSDTRTDLGARVI